MKCVTIYKYSLCFRNPFVRYVIDLDRVGTLDIIESFVSTNVHTYHLNRISELQMRRSPLQKLFRTGTIQFKVHEYNQVSDVIIKNIKAVDYIYGLLNYYKQSIMRK